MKAGRGRAARWVLEVEGLSREGIEGWLTDLASSHSAAAQTTLN